MLNRVSRTGGLLFTTMLLAAAGSLTTAVAQGNARDGFAGLPEARAAAFEIYVQKLGFGSAPGSVSIEQPFECGLAANCGGKTSVVLRVTPSDYSSDVDWKDATGNGKGHVVAKIVVVDPAPYDRMGLQADDVAYLWVGTIQGGKGAALYRVRGGKVTMAYKFTDVRYCKSSAYQPPTVHLYMTPKCTNPDPSPPTSSSAAAATASISTNDNMIMLVSSPVFRSSNAFALSGLWVSCSGGCCEVQY